MCVRIELFTPWKDIHTYAQGNLLDSLFICSFSTGGKKERGTGDGPEGRRRFSRAGKRGERKRKRRK